MDEYKSWLKASGVDLPERRLDRLATKIARELESRVGNTITDQLTDEQLAGFDEVVAEANRMQLEWLTQNYPDYSKVVQQETVRLHDELAKSKNPAVLIKQWH